MPQSTVQQLYSIQQVIYRLDPDKIAEIARVFSRLDVRLREEGNLRLRRVAELSDLDPSTEAPKEEYTLSCDIKARGRIMEISAGLGPPIEGLQTPARQNVAIARLHLGIDEILLTIHGLEGLELDPSPLITRLEDMYQLYKL